MEITCDTKLSEILLSRNVTNTFNNAASGVKDDCTMPRQNVIGTEIEKTAIKDTKISGGGEMYSAGVNVKSSYESFHASLSELQSAISTAAVNQEILELRDLISKVTTKINNLEDDKDDYERKKKAEEDEAKKSEYQSKINNLNRHIESYQHKKDLATARLGRLGEEYVEPTGGGSSQEHPEPEMVTVIDSGTKMEYNANNPGERTLTYLDHEENEYVTEYSYDDAGNPVCTITNPDGTSITYEVGEGGVVYANGEPAPNYEYFQYFCIEDATTGAVVEVPVLMNGSSDFAAMGFGMGNGDYAYVHQTFFENTTGDRFGGYLTPSVGSTRQEVSDGNGNVTQYVYYRTYQTNPGGYPPTTE